MVDTDAVLLRIKTIESSIDDTMWSCLKDENHERALHEYEEAKRELESIEVTVDEVKRERDRVLSYCLMRINDALENLEQSDGSIERAEQSLELAKASEDRVQILRSKLALGVTLLNLGKVQEAEEHFTDIILQTQDETDNRDVIQVYGWTLIVRVNISMGKSLQAQAKELAGQAFTVLKEIENYAGLRTVCSLLSKIYQSEGDTENGELYKRKSEEYATLAIDLKQ